MTNEDSPSPQLTSRRSEVDAFYDGSIALTSGAIQTRTARWESERCFEGLKLVILQAGQLICKLPNCPRQEIAGPCVCVIWNEGDHEASQCFEPGAAVQYTTVALSAQAIERQLGADMDDIRTLFSGSGGGPRLLIQPSPRSICSLCMQVSACPLQGTSRQLYLSGKALEMAAHALSLLDSKGATASATTLSSKDVEKLQCAKHLLEQRLQKPPSLAELGVAAGLNTRKLTEGFRQVFGASVFEHLQELRLEAAYRMIADGEMSVSSAAYQVGYSAAHLSVAFRKKFGISPKTLRN